MISSVGHFHYIGTSYNKQTLLPNQKLIDHTSKTICLAPSPGEDLGRSTLFESSSQHRVYWAEEFAPSKKPIYSKNDI